jgi:S-adenosyl-L-methionine hydrolase (adenosine-forming)
MGVPLTALGPSIDRRDMVTGVVPRCRFSASGCLEGAVVAIDRFGNLMTSIDAASLDTLRLRAAGQRLTVELNGKPIGGIVSSYNSVGRHMPLAILGSRGLLEISVNCGNANRILDADKKDAVRVRST